MKIEYNPFNYSILPDSFNLAREVNKHSNKAFIAFEPAKQLKGNLSGSLEACYLLEIRRYNDKIIAISFASKLNVDFAQFYVATTYSCTEIIEKALRKSKLPNDWSKSNYAQENPSEQSLSDMPAIQLYQYVEEAYCSFYYRPTNIAKTASIRSSCKSSYYLKVNYKII